MFGKEKEMLHLLSALFSEAIARNFGLRVPGFCAFGKECVFSFSSLRSSDGVSAQQEKKSVFSVSLLRRKKCGHCAAAAQTFACVFSCLK